MKILIELKNSLTENKKPIFFAIIITLFFAFLWTELINSGAIPKFSIFPLHFTGYWKEKEITFKIDGLYGVVMAVVLLWYKKKFSSFREIALISFWPSFFLVIIFLIYLNIFLIYKFGAHYVYERITPLILADFFGLIWFNIAFVAISVLLNWMYFKIKKH